MSVYVIFGWLLDLFLIPCCEGGAGEETIFSAKYVPSLDAYNETPHLSETNQDF